MKLIAIMLMTAALTIPARADDKSLELLIGPLLPLTKVDSAGKQDKIASGGVALGGRFLSKVSPGLSLGAELTGLMPGEHQSNVLVANAATSSKFSSLLFMGEAKLAAESGSIRPFVLGGIGLHSTHATAISTPLSGFVWSDTGTRETRTVVDSTKTTLAGTLQGGVDIPLQDKLTLGVSAAWYYLGKATYGSVSGSISSVAFLGSLAYRF